MSRPHITWIAATFVVVAGFGALSARGEPQTKDQKPTTASQGGEKKKETDSNTWMRMKLHSSQEIFAGLSRGDGKAIETNARRMLVLNFLEQWRTGQTAKNHSDYDAQLNAFEYATKELVRAGQSNDIDGALEAYLLLSKSCVRCHQLIRDVAAAK